MPHKYGWGMSRHWYDWPPWHRGSQTQLSDDWHAIQQCNIYCILTCYTAQPINHLCSLTVQQISKKHFIYRSVQMFKIMFRRFLFSRIWSSAQDHAVLVLLLNLEGSFISSWPRWSGGNVLYYSCTSFEGASPGGQTLNIFTWFIGAGGRHAMGWLRWVGSLKL